MLRHARQPDPTIDLREERPPWRKLLLDELVIERDAPPLPPEPVFTIDPLAVDEPGTGRRRRGELEELARWNGRAAEEARRIALEQRRYLLDTASARSRAEREAAALRREVQRLSDADDTRIARARYRAEREARDQVAEELRGVEGERARIDEIGRLESSLADQQKRIAELDDCVRTEQRARVAATREARRATDALEQTERRLETATETLRRTASDELAQIEAAEASAREALVERDRVSAELEALTGGDGRLQELTDRADSLSAQVRGLEAALADETTRAETAERESAVAAEQLDSARQECAAALGATESVRAELDTAHAEAAELATKTSRHDEALARYEELERTLVQKDEELEAATAENEALAADLAGATSARDQATAGIAELEAQLTDAEQRAAEKKSEAVAVAATVHEAEVAAVQAEADQLRKHTTALATQLAAAREDVERLSAALESRPAHGALPMPVILPGDSERRRSALTQLSALAAGGTGEPSDSSRRHRWLET
jgi:hypothetical protein